MLSVFTYFACIVRMCGFLSKSRSDLNSHQGKIISDISSDLIVWDRAAYWWSQVCINWDCAEVSDCLKKRMRHVCNLLYQAIICYQQKAIYCSQRDHLEQSSAGIRCAHFSQWSKVNGWLDTIDVALLQERRSIQRCWYDAALQYILFLPCKLAPVFWV